MGPKDSPLLSVYVHHLFSLTKSVVENCDAIFRETPLPTTGFYIKVSPELHARIDAVLIAAANIKKLVISRDTKGSSESTRAYKFRRKRCEVLSQLLDGLELGELFNAQARNSLEHFDEHLDQLAASVAAGEPAPSPMAAYNLAVSHW